MKKYLLTLLVVFTCSLSFGQAGYEGVRNNGTNQTTERYVQFSPGNTPSSSYTTWRVKDSTYIEWNLANAYFKNLPNTVNNGNPVNFLHTDASGRMQSSSVSWLYPDTLITFVTKSYLSTNNYTKAQSDFRYLQTFTEQDPLSLHLVDTIPVYSIFVPLSRTLTINGVTQDLSVNRSFSVGTLVASDTASLSNRINLKLNSADSSQYQTKYRSDTSRTALYGAVATKFTIPTGTTLQYLNGVGTPITFPTIPAQVNVSGGLNTKVTGSYPNITVADSFITIAYSTGGLVSQNIKTWAGTFTPNTSSGYSVDISGAGFGTVLSVQLSAFENVATEKGVIVSGKTKSTTTVTMNFYRSKLTGVLIGGNVEGLEFHPTPANISVCVTVIGY